MDLIDAIQDVETRAKNGKLITVKNVPVKVSQKTKEVFVNIDDLIEAEKKQFGKVI